MSLISVFLSSGILSHTLKAYVRIATINPLVYAVGVITPIIKKTKQAVMLIFAVQLRDI